MLQSTTTAFRALAPRWAIALMLSSAASLPVAGQVSPLYPYVVPQTVDPLFTNLTIPATAATQGMWSSTYSWPLVGLHVTVMPDGRVISFGTPDGQGVQDGRTLDLWDPRQGFVPASHLTVSNSQLVDSFCGTATMLPSGKLLISGGGSSGDGYTSFGNTLVTPSTSTTQHSSNLNAQRWYSTMTTLADGRALITGGGTPYAIVNAYANPSSEAANISETPEVYSPTTGWTSLMGASSADAFGPVNNRAWYPRQWVAPDGTVFGISTENMWSLDPTGNGSLKLLGTFKTTVNNTTTPNVGPTSTAVMYDTGKIMQAGGNGYNNGYASPSSPYASLFDITKSGAPVVTETAAMTYARQWPSSTVLPDGKVLVTGGSTYADNAGTNAVYPVEIWNPATGKWTAGASAANYRGYHSAASLLPDGVVLSTGGGVPGPVTNLNAEVYYPPYLFASANGKAALAARPRVVSLSTNSMDYTDYLQAQMADSSAVTEVSLIGLTSVTHSFNTSQRRMKLVFTQTGGLLTITMPASASLAPPGYYQISMLNASRVPSPGVILALHATAPPASTTTALLPIDGALRSIGSQTTPGNLLRHYNFQGYMSPISPSSSLLDRQDSSFYTRAGNANSACYSFESVNYPGRFLRHQNFVLYLQQNDNSGLFAADSTFCAIAGLSGTGFSLQSYNYPAYYLHQRNPSMGIDTNDGSATFAQNASFVQSEMFLPVDSSVHSFGSIAQDGALIRHANYIGYVTSINQASSPSDISDSSFYVRQGHANTGCYSFEAMAFPGYFLRVKSDLSIGLIQSDTTAAFASDSTFCLAAGLANDVGFSLTSYTYPNDYLRQSNFQLFVAPDDQSANFPTDATFTLNPAP